MWGPQVEALAKQPDVYVRIIDIDSWDSPVAAAHGVESLPHVVLWENGRQTASGMRDVFMAAGR